MIEFESVSKTFRDGTAAVVDLSLTVPSDKITVIVGPSGCGKTTTLRMVNRMLEPTGGRVLWDGAPLRSKRKTTLRRQMGYVIQSGGLFPHRTVLENIGTVPGLLHWSKDKTRKRSLELLASVGLDRKLANRYPAQLSGGQQQRVGVARALAADPMVLLMDEPFSAVDPVVRGELHDFFLGLQREISKTIVLITHDIDEAIKLGDQVAILRVGGRLAQVGAPQHLLEEPADAFVEGFVGKDRGFRSLSFLPADGLRLDRVDVVREVAAVESDEPTLVVDGEARPIGWAHRDQPGQVLPLGSTFVPESDTLRTALDSALTSPYGLAVAVAPDTGRFAGVVSARNVLGQVADARAASAESIELSARSPEPEAHPEPETGPKPVEGGDEAAPAPSATSPVAPPAEAEGAVRTGSTRLDGSKLSGRPGARPDPEAASKPELRPEPVGGSGEGTSTGQAPIADGPPPEEEDSTRIGSTRLNDLQLSAEPPLRPEPVEESDDQASSGSSPIAREPVERPVVEDSAGAAHSTGDREPDRDHVR